MRLGGVLIIAQLFAIFPVAGGAVSGKVPGPLSFDASGRALARSQDLPLRACVKESHLPQSWEAPFKTIRLQLQPVSGYGTPNRRSGQADFWEVKLRQAVPPRAYCNWFEWVPGLSCGKCTEKAPCHQDTARILGMAGRAGSLPPRGGCVYIDAISSSPKSELHAFAVWESMWDPFVFVRIAVGLLLFFGASAARESPTVHAAIGGVCALAVVCVVLVWWVMREVRNFLPVPGASGIAFSLSLAAIALFPGLSGLLSRGVPTSVDECVALINNARDPFYGSPIGWILLCAVALGTFIAASLGAKYSMQWFARPAEKELKKEVEFTIGSDGRRIDMVPGIPWPQALLGVGFKSAGFFMLLQSTHCDPCSFGIAVTAILGGLCSHTVGRLTFTQAEDQHFCPIVDAATFDKEGLQCTSVALQELRAYIRSDPRVVLSVREDSELRLRRFSDGGRDFPGASALVEPRDERPSCSLL